MQRSVLLGAGAAIVIVGGALALRAVSHHEVTGQAAQAVDHELAELLAGAHVTHGPIVEDGLTGTATVHDLAVAQPDGQSWTAGTMVLSGVHTAALRDVFDPANYPNGHPAWTDRRKLLGDLTLNTVHISAKGDQPGDITIAKAELHGLSGRPFALPPTAQNRTTKAFATDAVMALAFDSERVTGLSVVAQGKDAFKLTMATAGADGYDLGKLASLDVKSLALDGSGGPKHTQVHAEIGAIGLKRVDTGGLLAALRSGDQSSALGGVTYGVGDGSDMALRVTPGPALAIHAMHAEQGAPGGTGIVEKHGTVTGMTLGIGDTALPASAAAEFAAFGMNSLTMDINASQRAQADGATEISQDIDLHDLGTLHLRAGFSGFVPPSGANLAPGAALAGLLATTVRHATIGWEDRSLTNRIFKVAAVEYHSTPEALRRGLAMPLLALGAVLPDQPDAADQITRFLNNPHQLTVTMSPPTPVTLNQVAQAPVTEQAHLLGVHIASQ